MRTSSFGPIKLPDRDLSDFANCSVGNVNANESEIILIEPSIN